MEKRGRGEKRVGRRGWENKSFPAQITISLSTMSRLAPFTALTIVACNLHPRTSAATLQHTLDAQLGHGCVTSLRILAPKSLGFVGAATRADADRLVALSGLVC
jgi:hypothetical protein